ncbi:MAG: transposase [Christensenellaceae bacterium]|jgi:hypothetical protein|nr:transposase [Christensenellaceae bacterium]
MMEETILENGKEPSFIRFYVKEKDGNRLEYGSIQKSVWVNGTCKSETLLWLGKVLNKEEMIFKSRKNGIYKFTPPDTITPLSTGEIGYFGIPTNTTAQPLIGKELAEIYEPANCLSFGGVYVASQLLRQSTIADIIMDPFAGVKGLGDCVMALVLYKLTQGGASMHIKNWWDETYAKFLYPNINLDSPRISELLKEIGKEKYWRIFFENYSEFIKKESPVKGVILDSTGLQNAIQTALSQISNHGGKINREIRLIVVLDRISGYPLYFKYVPGNIVDKSTLQHIFHEMEAYDFEIASALMDAGYFNEEDLKFLYDRKVSFVTRFIPNRKIYKKIMANEIDDIDDLKYHVKKDSRFMKIKCIQVNDMLNMQLYVYVCKDLVEANKGEFHILNNFDFNKSEFKEIEEIREKLRRRGIFILLSSIKLPTDKILHFYYERQDIEQIFDFAKNDVDLLPLRVHSEATLRGHFMIVFFSTIAHVYMRRILEKKQFKMSRSAAFEILSRHVTIVYDKKNFHLPSIPSPTTRKIYAVFNIEIPKKMLIQQDNKFL